MTIKRLFTAAGVVALTLLLSACISLKAEITLDADARASGTMSIAMNKQLANFVGITSPDDFGSQIDEDEDSGLPAGAAIDVSETDTEYVATVSFEDAALEDDDFKAEVLANGNVSFTFVNDGMDQGAQENPFGDLSAGSVTVTVTFPGEVTEFSGEGATQVDPDTIRWEFPFETSATATATSTVSMASIAAAASASSSSMLLIVLLGVAAAFAVLVAAALLARRGRKEPVPAGAMVSPAPVPSAPAPAQPMPTTQPMAGQPTPTTQPMAGQPMPTTPPMAGQPMAAQPMADSAAPKPDDRGLQGPPS